MFSVSQRGEETGRGFEGSQTQLRIRNIRSGNGRSRRYGRRRGPFFYTLAEQN